MMPPPLPEEWESKDHDAFKKGNKFVTGCLDKYSKQELGSKDSPFIVYV